MGREVPWVTLVSLPTVAEIEEGNFGIDASSAAFHSLKICREITEDRPLAVFPYARPIFTHFCRNP